MDGSDGLRDVWTEGEHGFEFCDFEDAGEFGFEACDGEAAVEGLEFVLEVKEYAEGLAGDHADLGEVEDEESFSVFFDEGVEVACGFGDMVGVEGGG